MRALLLLTISVVFTLVGIFIVKPADLTLPSISNTTYSDLHWYTEYLFDIKDFGLEIDSTGKQMLYVAGSEAMIIDLPGLKNSGVEVSDVFTGWIQIGNRLIPPGDCTKVAIKTEFYQNTANFQLGEIVVSITCK